MINRRNFLRQAGPRLAGALTLGGLSLPVLSRAGGFGPHATYAPGIQLFTLFRQMNEDPVATLKQVAAVGYKEIETAFNLRGGYYGYSAKDFRNVVNDLGLTWRGHHAGGAPFRPRPATTPPATAPVAGAPAGTSAARPAMDFSKMPPMLNLRDNYQQLVDQAAEGGLTYLVCASTPIATLDDVNKSIEVFQKTGEAAKKAGVGFAYHNHATEFDPVEGGRSAYELILSQTDKDLVKMELDLAWAYKAGKDPVALFTENPGRFPLWHVKDMKDDKKTITEIGNGSVDFSRTFSAAPKAGLKYIFVEQDMAPGGIDSIMTSYRNLTKILA